MNDLSVLLVGEVDEASGFGVDAAREQIECFARVEQVDDLSEAAARLADANRPIHLLVLAESRPGQFSSKKIDELRRAAPLVRVWRLLGGWCEGEQRSGRPPEGCTRSYWHQWRERFAREAAAARDGRCPAWGFPLTLTADERTLADAWLDIPQREGRVVVCAAHNESAASLADACRLGGYDTAVMRDTDPTSWQGARAMAVLWDTTAERACDPRLVQRLRQATWNAPLLAVIGFPRPEDTRRAIAAGISKVISKPLVITDLLWCLGELAAR
jgi:hypothetical protein